MPTERCDRCGGRVEWVYEHHGKTLLLCKTHSDQHAKALDDQHWKVALPA